VPLKCLWSLSVSRFYSSKFHFGRKKAPNQVFLPTDRSSSRSSLKKANIRGKYKDVRLFVPRMVILYLKTFVRYGPLLNLHKSDFGSTSISICSKFLASPKLNLASLTLAFFSLYSDMRLQTSKIIPLL